MKHGATLGANCTVVCGVTIGEYGFVGAGAVITRNVPDHGLMLGNPARRVGWMCACGERIDQRTDDGGQRTDADRLECMGCGNQYEEEDNGLKEVFRQDLQD